MWSNKNKNSDQGSRDPEEMEVKVVLVGDAHCGKTSLVQRFISDHFIDIILVDRLSLRTALMILISEHWGYRGGRWNVRQGTAPHGEDLLPLYVPVGMVKGDAYTPTGFEKYSATYNVADYKITFSVWDTSGTPAYDSVRPLAYQDAGVFLLCFTVSEPESLQTAVTKWYQEIRTHCPATPVILCGCRSDLRLDPDIQHYLAKHHLMPVTSEQALAVSRQLGATTYVETSARTSAKGVRDAFEVAALAALGKLNKNHNMTQKQKQVGRSKSKRDLKAELKGRAKSCCVM